TSSFLQDMIYSCCMSECINSKIILLDSRGSIRKYDSIARRQHNSGYSSDWFIFAVSLQNSNWDTSYKCITKRINLHSTYPPLSGAVTGKWTYTQTNGAIVPSLIFNEHFFEPFGFEADSINTFNGNSFRIFDF